MYLVWMHKIIYHYSSLFINIFLIRLQALTMAGKYYSMTLVWQIPCKFIFPTWYTQTLTTFIIGCIVTMILAFISMGLPKIRAKIEKALFSQDKMSSLSQNAQQLQSVVQQQKPQIRMTPKELIIKKKIIPLIYSLIYALFHVSLMLILMSMNGYVILAIITGYTAGFSVFSEFCSLKKEKSCHGGCSTIK